MSTALNDLDRGNPRCLLSAPHTVSVTMSLTSSLWCLLLVFCCNSDLLFCTATSISSQITGESLKRSSIKTSPPWHGEVTSVGGSQAVSENVNDFHSQGVVEYSLLSDNNSARSLQWMPVLPNYKQLREQTIRNGGRDLNVKKTKSVKNEQKTVKLHHKDILRPHQRVSKEFHQPRHNIDYYSHGKNLHLEPFLQNSVKSEINSGSIDPMTKDGLKHSIQQVKSKAVVIHPKRRLRRGIDSDIWLTFDGQNRISANQAEQIQLYPSDRSNALSQHQKETVLHWLCRLNSRQSCDCIKKKIPWYVCARLDQHTVVHNNKPSNDKTEKVKTHYSTDQNNLKHGIVGLRREKLKNFNTNSRFSLNSHNKLLNWESSDTLRQKRGITHSGDEVLINTTDSLIVGESSVDIHNDTVSSEKSTASASGSVLLKNLVTASPGTNDGTKFAIEKSVSVKTSVKNKTTHTPSTVYQNQEAINFSKTERTVSAFNESDINSVTAVSDSTGVFENSSVTDMHERTSEQDTLYHTNNMNKSLTVDLKFPEKLSVNDIKQLPDYTSVMDHGGYDHVPKQPSKFAVKIQLFSHIFTDLNTVSEETVSPTRSMNISAVKPMFVVPQPEWSSAKQLWQGAWGFHVYTVAIVFSILSVYLAVSMMRLYRMKNFLSQGYFISLTSIVFVMSFFRSFYFWIDGYNSSGTFPSILAYFLYTVPLPCITSAFSILFLALLNSTKMQLLSKRIQKPSFIGGIIAFHFFLSLISDIVVGSFYKSKVMFFVCQIAFVLWGLILFGGYIYIFHKLYKAARRRQKELERISLSKVRLQGVSPIRQPPKLALSLAIKVTLITAIFGLMMAMLQVYAMTGVHSIFSEEKPSPWPWWWFQFGVRIVEIGMCVTMSFVATQPVRYNQSDNHRNWLYNFLHLAPCKRLFECDSYQTTGNHEIYWDDNSTVFINVEENPLDMCNFNTDEPVESGTNVEEMVPLNGKNVADADKNGSLPHSASRPQSLLISDNGFIRFRQEHDVDVESIVMTTDDELDSKDILDFHSPSSLHVLDQNHSDRMCTDVNHTTPSGDDTSSPADSAVTQINNINRLESHLYSNSAQRPDTLHVEHVPDSDYMGDVSEINSPMSDGQISEDYLSVSDISLKPPSSINLGLSIENALNMCVVDIDINKNSDREELCDNTRRCSDSDVLEAGETMNTATKYFGGKLNGDNSLDKDHGNCNNSETPDSDIHSVTTLLCRSNSESRSSTFSRSTPQHIKYSHVTDSSGADSTMSTQTSLGFQNNTKKRTLEDEDLCQNKQKGQQQLDSSFSDVCYAIDQLSTQTNQDFQYL